MQKKKKNLLVSALEKKNRLRDNVLHSSPALGLFLPTKTTWGKGGKEDSRGKSSSALLQNDQQGPLSPPFPGRQQSIQIPGGWGRGPRCARSARARLWRKTGLGRWWPACSGSKGLGWALPSSVALLAPGLGRTGSLGGDFSEYSGLGWRWADSVAFGPSSGISTPRGSPRLPLRSPPLIYMLIMSGKSSLIGRIRQSKRIVSQTEPN